MEQGSRNIRLAAVAATVIALLAISVPFLLGGGMHDEDAAAATAAAEPRTEGDAVVASMDGEQESAACMADAKPANLDYTLPDINGNKVALSSFKGKVILLNFWATWCGPCKVEIPDFVQLQNQYKDDLVVVGFSVDDTAEKAKAFAADYKINYPVLLGLGHEDVQDAYGPLYGIPASFLISRDGKVCKRHMGMAPKATFEREIKNLL